MNFHPPIIFGSARITVPAQLVGAVNQEDAHQIAEAIRRARGKRPSIQDVESRLLSLAKKRVFRGHNLSTHRARRP